MRVDGGLGVGRGAVTEGWRGGNSSWKCGALRKAVCSCVRACVAASRCGTCGRRSHTTDGWSLQCMWRADRGAAHQLGPSEPPAVPGRQNGILISCRYNPTSRSGMRRSLRAAAAAPTQQPPSPHPCGACTAVALPLPPEGHGGAGRQTPDGSSWPEKSHRQLASRLIWPLQLRRKDGR